MEKKSLKLIIECEDGMVLGDEEYLFDAFWQLISNAIQFCTNAGEVRIRSFRQDNQLCIVIEDDGVGMAADVLPHIFKRFFRLDSAHSTAGFGLGLPLAQSIVERHNGEIKVQSVLGEGSHFEVWLPLIKQA
jgi:signal transduction histidine kinase